MSVRFSTLDRRRLRELKPGEKITEPGITVVRLADGDLRYSVAIMVDGERIYRVIGKASERVTRTQCEEFIAQKQTEARAGRLSLPKARKLALTVAAAARRYLQRLEESGGNNIPIKRRQLDIYLVPYFGAQRLDAITEFAVGKYKKQRLGAGAANATINRELATLSYLFYSAVDWKWLDRVPVRLGKHKLPEGDGRIIVLPDEACDRLMRAATAGADPDCWLFVAFGLNTAMRHTEILSARWDKLDLPNRRLFVQVKGGAWREQPITPRLADILARERKMREDREGWITPSPHADNGTGQRVRMDRAFDDAARRGGLDPVLITPHVMRHTAITKLVQAGVDIPTIQASAVTRPWRWCCATCTRAGNTSIRASKRSAAACRRHWKTASGIRELRRTPLHRNYTRGAASGCQKKKKEGKFAADFKEVRRLRIFGQWDKLKADRSKGA